MTIEKKIIMHCSLEELNAIKGIMQLLDDMDDNVYNELIKSEIVSKDFYDEVFSLFNLMKDGELFM